MFNQDEMLNMVFTTAIEGGINYWAKVIEYHWTFGEPEYKIDPAFYAVIVESDKDRQIPLRIDSRTITRGISRAWNHRRKLGDYHWVALDNLQFNRYDDVDFDADTADIIVQYGLFGELIFG